MKLLPMMRPLRHTAWVERKEVRHNGKSIIENFRSIPFSRMVNRYHFAGLIFADTRTHTHVNRAYFTGLIFLVHPQLEHFLLYGSLCMIVLLIPTLSYLICLQLKVSTFYLHNKIILYLISVQVVRVERVERGRRIVTRRTMMMMK